MGLETAARSYCSVNSWGTPDRLIEQLEARRKLIGDFELSTIVNYGGMSYEEAESSLRLFATEVLPELHRW